MFNSTVTRSFNFLLLSLALSACGGGGGGGSDGGGNNGGGNGGGQVEEPELNLSATSIEVLTEDPQISYPLKVAVGLSSDKAAQDVHVSLFVMEISDDPDAEVRQIPIGSEIVELVDGESGPFEFEMNIPASVELEGDYYIQAVVDPADEVFESDEEDNSAAVEANISIALMPNIFMTEMNLDRASLEVSTLTYEDQVDALDGNVYNADASAEITVGTDGLEVDQTIEAEAFANLRMSRSDTGTSHDVPLYLWNSEEGRYMNAYGVDPSGDTAASDPEWLPIGVFEPQLVTTAGDETTLDDVERNTTHMNFYFPGKLGKEMAYEMRYGHLPVFNDFPGGFEPELPPPDLSASAISALRGFLNNLPTNYVLGDESDAMAVMDFEICVEIRSVNDLVDDYTLEDNEICSPIEITLPPVEQTPPPPVGLGGYVPQYSTPANPIISSNGYKTKGGGSVFAFGLDFGDTASADYRGYKEDIHARIPVTIFGITSNFLSIDVNAQLVPDYPGRPAEDDSRFRIEISHAGQIMASVVELPKNTEIALELDELSFSKELPDPNKGGVAEATFFVGPIPLSAGAYVSGNLGVDFKPFIFNADNPDIILDAADSYRIGVSGGPYANIEAVMYAGVGSRRLPVLVGIEGVLTLLDERIEFFDGVEIEYIDKVQESDPVEFIIRQGPKISNIFTGPQGKINLFAQYTVPKVKTCKVKLGLIRVKIPCPGFVKLKATKNIWTSKAAFQQTDVLYENPNVVLDVVIPASGDPQYFSP